MNDLIYKTWVLWELSTPRRDLITDELANCSRRRFFQTLQQRAQSGMSAKPALKFKPRRGDAFSVSRQVSENSELFKKPEPVRGPPPPSSHAAHWEGQKRSPPLVPDIVLFEAVQGHWTQKGYKGPHGIHGQTVPPPSVYIGALPLGLNRPWALTWGEEKSYLPFVFTPHHPTIPTPIAFTLNADLSTDH